MSEWQSIETAPKDGREIIVWYPVSRHDGEYMLAHWNVYGIGRWKNDEGVTVSPTHWMPLPEPPESK